MTCQELDDRIEALASEDVPQTPATQAHLAECLRCQAAFARARRLEQWLVARPAPPAPPRFTADVLARVRRERWQSEQALDRWFNLTIAAASLLVVMAVALLANVSGIAAVSADVARVMRDGMSLVAARFAADLPTYAIASGLLLSTIAVWWLAEQRTSL
jgi:anti-sigma factor RsiW